MKIHDTFLITHQSLKQWLFAALLITCLGDASAQQDAGFSQYFFNQLYINPAYTGSRQTIAGTIVHRSQWVNMPGAPTTQSATIHSPINNTHSGLGLMVYNDKAGPLGNTGVQASYSYYVPVGKYKLAFGLSGGAHNIRVNYDDIRVEDRTDGVFNGNASSWIPDASAGIYLYRNRFYAGVSALHLFEPSFDLGSTDNAEFKRHYYFTSGIVFRVNDNVDFRPSVLAKFINSAPVVLDGNASFIFYQRLFLGAGFRHNQRVNIDGSDNVAVAIAEFNITPSLRLGYSYDWYLNHSGNYTSGTHEIMLGFDINPHKTKMTSPRYF
ncbi:MAG: type IX secretion system membrane protein PorP/SprF [Bacteroidota bacterium]